jgi:hypothetical protein
VSRTLLTNVARSGASRTKHAAGFSVCRLPTAVYQYHVVDASTYEEIAAQPNTSSLQLSGRTLRYGGDNARTAKAATAHSLIG